MAFAKGIQKINFLAANLATSADIVPNDITGFSESVGAGTQLIWRLRGVFTIGATGGFRFLAHCTVAPTVYNAEYITGETGSPATYEDAFSAEADFTNAAAVADSYPIFASGYILAAAATVFSLQFAQNNSTANAITLLRGMTMEVWLF